MERRRKTKRRKRRVESNLKGAAWKSLPISGISDDHL